MIELNQRVHLYARPSVRTELAHVLTDVLGLRRAPVVAAPTEEATLLAFLLDGGGSLSVEFREDALSDDYAERGAWLELVSDEPLELQERVLRAGMRRIHHPQTGHFYFQAPGGQVFRICHGETATRA